MAVDMFIKLDNVTGEAQDDKHKDEIDVLAWSWGMSQSGTTHMGSGGGAGKVHVNDLSFTKYVDKASATLMRMCCDGTHIPKGKLIVRKAGKTPLEYIVMEIKEIIVTNVSTGGSHGEDRLTENVTLNFGKFEYKYQKQKSDGSPDGGPATLGWDVSSNKAS